MTTSRCVKCRMSLGNMHDRSCMFVGIGKEVIPVQCMRCRECNRPFPQVHVESCSLKIQSGLSGVQFSDCDSPVDGPITNDPVNHPSHYTSHPSGVECVDIAEHYNFNVGNTIKYLWRAGLKGDEIEDLKKARWYLDREIERRTKSQTPT